MSEGLSRFLKSLRANKRYVFLAVMFAAFFFVVLFPYGDLSDLVTEQVARRSQNQVFLSFDDLGLNFVPPGIEMKDVVMESTFAPKIQAGSLSLAPSISGLLTFKPGFVAHFHQLFGGHLKLAMKTGKELPGDVRAQELQFDFAELQLRDLTRFANLPMEVRGKGRIQFDGDIDPTFTVQPDSQYNIDLGALEVPAGSIPTPIGPLNLPTINVSGLKITGRLVNGELIIEDSTIGKAGDFISGRIKGRMDLRVTSTGAGVRPIPGRYDLKVDLTLNRDAESQIGVFLSFLDKYKTLTGTGARYAVELTGTPAGLPQTKPLSGF